MKRADAFVLPSYYEGFPVVCIEALSLHTKVITTIDVSTGHFHLKDYVYLCKQNEKSIQETIERAVHAEPKKRFDKETFNEENKEVTYQILNGGMYEI